MKSSWARVEDAVALERRLEGEVVILEGLEAGQAGGYEAHLDAPALPGLELLRQEQIVDCLDSRELALLQAAQDVVEGLQGAGHLEADQQPAHLVATGCAARGS